MAGGAVNIALLLKAQGSQATNLFKGLKSDSGGFEKNLLAVNKAAKLAGAALAGLLTKAVIDASQFETKFAEVETLLSGVARETVQGLKNDLLDLAGGLGDVQSLTEAAYQAISAGVEPMRAIDTVTAAARLAAAGVTEVAVSTEALTRITNAYAREGISAAQASDTLFTIVKGGVTTMSMLAPTIGQVAGIAASAGVSLDELAAAIAGVTKALPTRQAVTGVRQLIVSLLKPSQALTDLFVGPDSLGFASVEAAIKMEGFGFVLKEIKKAAGDSVSALGKYIPEVEAMTAITVLTANSMAEFNKQMELQAKNAGSTDEAFGIMSRTLKFNLNAVMNKAEAIMAKIGLQILPMLTGKLMLLQDWMAKNGDEMVRFGVRVVSVVIPALEKTIKFITTLLPYLPSLAKGFAVAFVAGNILKFAAAIKVASAAMVLARGKGIGMMTMLKSPTGLMLAFAAVAIVTDLATKKIVAWMDSTSEAKAAVSDLKAATRVFERVIRDGLTPQLIELLERTDAVTLAGIRELAMRDALTSGAYPETNRKLRELIEHLDDMGDAQGDANDEMTDAERIVAELEAALTELDVATDDSADSTGRLEAAQESLGIVTAGDLTPKLRALTVLVEDGTTPVGQLVEQWESLADTYVESGTLSMDTREEMSRLRRIIEELGGEVDSTKDVNDDLNRSLDESAAAALEAGTSQEVLAENVAETTEAFDDATEAQVEFDTQIATSAPEIVSNWGQISNAVVSFGQTALDVIGNVFGVQIPSFVSAAINSFVQFSQGNIIAGVVSGISAIAGIITSFIKGKKAVRTERALEQFKQLGTLSAELAEKIAGLSIELSKTGRVLPDTVAGLLSLAEVLQEQGINSVDDMTYALVRAREATERFNDGTITEKELIEILNGVVPILSENLDLMSRTGAAVFREMIQNTRDAGVEIAALTELVERLTSEGADNVNAFAATFDDLATATEADLRLMRQQFNLMAGEMVANGASIFEVLEAFAPVIQQANDSGIELGGTFGFLQGMAVLLADEGIAKIVERQEAVNGMLRITAQLGLLTQDRFNAMGDATAKNFERLVELTGDETQALLLMAPSLVRLRDLAAEHNFELSEGVQALIDQGEEAGLVGERAETTNEIMSDMRDILREIARIFGVDMTDAARQWGDEATGQARRVRDEMGRIQRFQPGTGGGGGRDFIGARGGVFPEGGPFSVIAHAKEMLLPREISEFILDRVAGSDSSSSSAGATTILNVNVAEATFSDPISRKREARQVAAAIAQELGLRRFISGGA